MTEPQSERARRNKMIRDATPAELRESVVVVQTKEGRTHLEWHDPRVAFYGGALPEYRAACGSSRPAVPTEQKRYVRWCLSCADTVLYDRWSHASRI